MNNVIDAEDIGIIGTGIIWCALFVGFAATAGAAIRMFMFAAGF